MDGQPASRRLALVNAALAAVVGVFAFWAAIFPLTNTDIWWHLAAGKHMAATGGFIREDPFSFAPEGARWLDVHWLFQLLAYAVHSVAGVPALILAKAAVFAAACMLMLAAAYRQRTFALAALATAFAVHLVRFLVLVRPAVLSALYLALVVLALERYRQSKDRRLLWALPAVEILWTNTQGTFVLGPVTIACYLAGEALARRLAPPDAACAGGVSVEARLGRAELTTLLWVFLGTSAACMVSPYGPRILALPLALYSRMDPALADVYSRNVAENVPSWLIQRQTPGALWPFTALALAGAASFVAARRRISLPRAVLFAAYLYLGIIARYNLLFFALVAVPVIAGNLNAAVEGAAPAGRFARASRWFAAGVAAAALVAMLAFGIDVAVSQARSPEVLGLAPFRYPVEAADLLAGEEAGDGRDRNVFCSIEYGGYLIWRLYPKRKVFMDGRLVIRSREAFADYLRLLDQPERFGELEARYGMTRAVLPTAGNPRYLGLVRFLYRNPAWRLVYADGASALFEREDAAARERVDLSSAPEVAGIAARLDARFGPSPEVLEEAKTELGALLVYLGILDRAEDVLRPLGSPAARRHLARCAYLAGRPDEAVVLSMRLLEENPEDTNSLNLLGRMHLDRGELDLALARFRAVVALDPYNRQAEEAIEQIEAMEACPGEPRRGAER